MKRWIWKSRETSTFPRLLWHPPPPQRSTTILITLVEFLIERQRHLQLQIRLSASNLLVSFRSIRHLPRPCHGAHQLGKLKSRPTWFVCAYHQQHRLSTKSLACRSRWFTFSFFFFLLHLDFRLGFALSFRPLSFSFDTVCHSLLISFRSFTFYLFFLSLSLSHLKEEIKCTDRAGLFFTTLVQYWSRPSAGLDNNAPWTHARTDTRHIDTLSSRQTQERTQIQRQKDWKDIRKKKRVEGEGKKEKRGQIIHLNVSAVAIVPLRHSILTISRWSKHVDCEMSLSLFFRLPAFSRTYRHRKPRVARFVCFSSVVYSWLSFYPIPVNQIDDILVAFVWR